MCRWWLFAWLLRVMIGGRCHGVRKMMGRGAEGGCGTEERACPVSRVPSRIPGTQPGLPERVTGSGVDFWSQARKAVCERSPYDVAEETSASAVPTLPTGLASFLSRQSDGRKRQKKAHSAAEKKSSRQGEKARVSNVWVETEEYFRLLKEPDIDNLSEISSGNDSASGKCFAIPFPGNAPNANATGSDNARLTANEAIVKEEEQNEDQANGPAFKGDGEVEDYANGAAIKEEGKMEDYENGVLVKEVQNNEPMEVDSLDAGGSHRDDKGFPALESLHGLEWLLGCRNRICLTSERPSKKRKLLGGDAGLDKVLIACPCEESSSLCHFCSKGDMAKDLNELIVCSNCKMTVHRKCYGVHEKIEECWLCSWCRRKNGSKDITKPCVLCPKQAGALKPIYNNVDHGISADFAHLFCSLWMPEVYINDLELMEPIMNVGEILENRRKLVCNVCKVKWGTCVRCSYGTCRTSFHPICAREAKHRMEVWGKYGCDNVELRAFCLKHSAVPDGSSNPQLGDSFEPIVNDAYAVNHVPVTLSVNRPQKLLVGRRNGDNIGGNVEAPDISSEKSNDCELQSKEMTDFDAWLLSEGGNAQGSAFVGELEKGVEDVNPSDPLKFAALLKKLIDRGRVSLKDVASEMSISPDTLSARLAADNLVPDLGLKIVKWVNNHVYVGTLKRSLRVKIKSSSLSKAGVVDDSIALPIPGSDYPDPANDGLVPLQSISRSKEILGNDEALTENVLVEKLDNDKPKHFSKEFPLSEKCPFEHQDSQDFLAPKHEGSAFKPSNCGLRKVDGFQEPVFSVPNSLLNGNRGGRPVENPVIHDHLKAGESPSLYVHPYVKSSTENELSHLEPSSCTSVGCNPWNEMLNCKDLSRNSDGLNVEQLLDRNTTGILELSSQDEVEGEIIYFQNKLLENAVSRKRLTDGLINNVAKTLPKEIDGARNERWDAVLVNQYLSMLREAKKQGKKERRHKEAQAVLAAATAAAAASSRVSSLRKDGSDDSANQLKLRARETPSRVSFPKTSPEKHSEYLLSTSEHPRSCDICRRPETILNPILVCSSCKVAVHLDCYCSFRVSSGPWYCELCEELSSSRSSGALGLNSCEKTGFTAECGLCGGTTGAFRKSFSGPWVHSFCAEWIFESTFRRGQENPVEGMEVVLKGVDTCYICRRKYGVCMKCNYGNCQSTFHPYCARSAGFFMSVKTSGGKVQHKAYCEKHSSEQRAKAESVTHGIEELKRIKHIRVELERLRLICERIVKREKIKRELVLCSHDILAFKRDNIARSALFRSPFLVPEVSSESATTSLREHTSDLKSCNEGSRRSDDITVDSTVKNWTKVPVPFDTDHKTDDDSSTSPNTSLRKHAERFQFAGKHLPRRPPVSTQNPVDGGCRLNRKPSETFQKELVMTSDQASVKNSLLPKRYLYVPADILAKEEKQLDRDAGSGKPIDSDG